MILRALCLFSGATPFVFLRNIRAYVLQAQNAKRIYFTADTRRRVALRGKKPL
jgi:hypothetical protein